MGGRLLTLGIDHNRIPGSTHCHCHCFVETSGLEHSRVTDELVRMIFWKRSRLQMALHGSLDDCRRYCMWVQSYNCCTTNIDHYMHAFGKRRSIVFPLLRRFLGISSSMADFTVHNTSERSLLVKYLFC